MSEKDENWWILPLVGIISLLCIAGILAYYIFWVAPLWLTIVSIVIIVFILLVIFIPNNE